MKEAYSSAYPKVPEAGMTGFFIWRGPMRTEPSGKPLIPVDLPDVIDRTILANQRVAGAPVLRPLEGRLLPERGFLDRSGAEGNRTGKACSEPAAHVSFKGDLTVETEALRERGQLQKHRSRAARIERAGHGHCPCFEKMKEELGRSSVKPETAVVRVKMKGPEALEFFLVKNAIFESGAHENVKTRFRNHGPHRFCRCKERGDSDPSCRQHNIGSLTEEKAIAQGADEIQCFSFPAGREPFGSFPYDPVQDLEAQDSILFRKAMHAEGTSQQGVHLTGAADVVKLAWDRGVIILGEIEAHPVAVLSDFLVFCDQVLHALLSAS